MKRLLTALALLGVVAAWAPNTAVGDGFGQGFMQGANQSFGQGAALGTGYAIAHPVGGCATTDGAAAVQPTHTMTCIYLGNGVLSCAEQ